MFIRRAVQGHKFTSGLKVKSFGRAFASVNDMKYDKNKDFYKMLGIETKTSAKDMKKAYYKLAK
jgi:hypothetical protein